MRVIIWADKNATVEVVGSDIQEVGAAPEVQAQWGGTPPPPMADVEVQPTAQWGGTPPPPSK